jgi:hypothetical protein
VITGGIATSQVGTLQVMLKGLLEWWVGHDVTRLNEINKKFFSGALYCQYLLFTYSNPTDLLSQCHPYQVRAFV